MPRIPQTQNARKRTNLILPQGDYEAEVLRVVEQETQDPARRQRMMKQYGEVFPYLRVTFGVPVVDTDEDGNERTLTRFIVRNFSFAVDDDGEGAWTYTERFLIAGGFTKDTLESIAASGKELETEDIRKVVVGSRMVIQVTRRFYDGDPQNGIRDVILPEELEGERDESGFTALHDSIEAAEEDVA
jgi:hypothetical protein